MKPLRSLILLLAFTAAISTACTDPYSDAESALNAADLVLEGWIDSNGTPVVLFSRSITPAEEGELSQVPIRWGKVTVSDGEKSVVLTGGPNSDFFPPYRYYTAELTGVPGRTYTVTAEDGYGASVSATCYMPSPTPINRIEITPIEGSDSLLSARLYFTAPRDVPAYYYLTMTPLGVNQQPLPTVFGTVETAEAGAEISIPIFHPKQELQGQTTSPNLQRGEVFAVTLNRVEKPVYEFWKSYENAVVFGSSQFVNSGGSLSGNVNGGYGVWAAKATSSRIVFL